MEYPNKVQVETCEAVSELETKNLRKVYANELKEVLKLKRDIISKRLNEYTRLGYLESEKDKDNHIRYGISDKWSHIITCMELGIEIEDDDEEGVLGVCKCGKKDYLVKFRGEMLCGECLNPQYEFKLGDEHHEVWRGHWPETEVAERWATNARREGKKRRWC
jgi:hypothetical protein